MPDPASLESRHSKLAVRLAQVVAALGALIVLSKVTPREWRTDLGLRAVYASPRLFGVLTAESLVWGGLMAGAIPLLAAIRARGRNERRRAFALIAGYAACILALAAADLTFRLVPDLLPERALKFSLYQARHLYPDGNPALAYDREVLARHRHSVMQGEVDFSHKGVLLMSRWVRDEGPQPGRYRLPTRREFLDDGLPVIRSTGEASARSGLLILGDSFVVNYGVPEGEIWPVKVSQSWLARTGAPAEAGKLLAGRLFACGGWTFLEGWRMFQRLYPAGTPSAIIVMIYEGNDLSDAYRVHDAAARGELASDYYAEALRQRPAGWVESSPLVALLRAAIAPVDFRVGSDVRYTPWLLSKRDDEEAKGLALRFGRTVRGGLEAELAPLGPPLPLARVKGGARLGIAPFEFIDLTRPGDDWPLQHPGWALMTQGIEEIATEARRRGIPFGVVVAPASLRVYSHLLDDMYFGTPELLQYLGRMETNAWQKDAEQAGGWQALVAQRRDVQARCWERFCRSIGVPYLDLAEGLRAAAEAGPELMHFPYDTHWSFEGNNVVANLMAEWASGEMRRVSLPAQ